ncbi:MULTISPECIES: hypothetical protein [Citrobacter]|nr:MULTISPECIES: hypothetical protein [Citrobacter]
MARSKSLKGSSWRAHHQPAPAVTGGGFLPDGTSVYNATRV